MSWVFHEGLLEGSDELVHGLGSVSGMLKSKCVATFLAVFVFLTVGGSGFIITQGLGAPGPPWLTVSAA